MEEDVSTIIPASVLHTGLENIVNKVCPILPILTQIQKKTLPRSISTCNVTCTNGGTCNGINSCICTTEYDGLQCEHKIGIINN